MAHIDVKSIAERIGESAERILPSTREGSAGIQKRLEQADIRTTPAIWRGLVAVVIAIGVLAGAVFAGRIGAVMPVNIVCLAVGGFAGWFTMREILTIKTRRYREKLEDSLPNALELLSITAAAGLPLERGFRELADHAEEIGPIANEFARMDRQINYLGLSRTEALESLAQRCQSQSISLFCSTLIQADRQGSSVVDILRGQAAIARKTFFDRLREKVSRVSVYLSIPIGLCFLPSILLFVMAPVVVSLTSFFTTGSS